MERRARGANRLLGFYEPRLLSARPRAGQTGLPICRLWAARELKVVRLCQAASRCSKDRLLQSR